MPILPNARHERFAQELAAGKSADEAYIAAGYNENRGNATRLKANESVLKRVAELKSSAAERAVITAESLIAEAEEARKLAMELGQPAAAVAAIKEKGVLSGVRVEKAERRIVNDPRQLSDAELDAEIERALAREAAADSRQALTH
jgi:phage terminase small subunit